MTDITARPVRVDAEIGGKEMNVTYAETVRAISGAGEVKLKGIVSNPDSIGLDDDVRVSIGTNDDKAVGFRGSVKRVTQNREGVTEVLAYDSMLNLYNKQVKLNTEQPRFANEVARELLDDAGFDVADRTADPSELDPGTAYVAPGRDFPDGDTQGKHTYGSAKSGDALYYVMNDLADKLTGVLWADRNNVLRLEPYPEKHSVYELPLIIEFDEGNEELSTQKVFVKGSSPTGSLGSGSFALYNRTSPSTSVQLGEKDDPPEKNIKDEDLVTQKAVDKRALSEQFKQGQAVDVGTVTVSGDPAIELYDRVTLPDRFTPTASDTILTDSGRLIPGPPSTRFNRFSVQEVRHVVDATDGYETTVELAPGPNTILDNISGVADKLKDDYTAKIDENEQNGFTASPFG